MGTKSEKKLVFKATISDEATAKLGLISHQFKAMTSWTDKLSSKFQKLSYSLSPITKKLSGITNAMGRLGRLGSLGTAAVALTPSAIATAGISKAADVESELAKLRVIADLDPKSVDLLKKEAVDIGKRTQFSTTDALEGMKNLAMNGMPEVGAIKDSIATTMDLTGASSLKTELPLAEVAKILSGTMNAFSLGSKNASMVSDKLAYSMQKSSMNMEELGAAMQKAAPLANSSGIKLDTLVSSLMILSKTNVKGEIAGTAFAGLFSRLMKPPKEAKDVLLKYHIDEKKFFTKDKQFKDLLGFFEMLEQKKVLNPDIMSLFGQEAGKYLVALVGHTKEWKKALHAVSYESKGIAAKLNAVNMEGFHGKMKFMSSSLEAIFIKLGDAGLLNIAKNSADHVNGVLDRIISLEKGNFKLLAEIAGITASLPTLLLLFSAKGAGAAALPFLGTAFGLGTGSVMLGGLVFTGLTAALVGMASSISSDWLRQMEFREHEKKNPLFPLSSFLDLTPIPLRSTPWNLAPIPMQPPKSSQQNSSITIDFRNIPRGAEVKTKNSSPGLDLLLQYENFSY